MAIQIGDYSDLIATTLNDMPDKEQFEITWDDNRYEAARIYQEERIVVDGGPAIERRVVFDDNGTANYRYMADTDTPSITQGVHEILVPWCLINGSYSYDEFAIINQKNSAKGFISLLKVERTRGLWSLASLMEQRLWLTPTSATDRKYPMGIPYYLNVKNAAGDVNDTEGFVGATIDYQDGSTGTACAGIDASVETMWRNYALLYTGVNNALLKSFRLAFMYTNFKAPLFVNDPNQKQSEKGKRVYTSPETVADLMDLADQRDDMHSSKEVLGNLRVDDGGLVTLNRLPVVPINSLTGVAYSPIYCVDLNILQPVVHDGYWMKETPPLRTFGKHTMYSVYIDGAHQNLLLNRRSFGFVCHKAS